MTVPTVRPHFRVRVYRAGRMLRSNRQLPSAALCLSDEGTMRYLATLLLLCLSSELHAQQPQNFGRDMISAYEMGARIRNQRLEAEALRQFYAEQAKLIAAQRKQIEAETALLAKQAQSDAEAAARQKWLYDEAYRQTALVFEMFSRLYPDWKEHEPVMTRLGQRIVPNKTSELEWLEVLYYAAKSPVGERVRKELDAEAQAQPKD